MTQVLLDPSHSLAEGNKGVIDPSVGGQQGVTTNPSLYISNDNFVRPKMLPVLIQVPGVFKYFDDPEYKIKLLKSLVELQHISITGVSNSLTTSFQESVFNNTEMFESVSRVERARSRPVFSWIEKRGKPIYKFIKEWIILGGQDPETGFPGIVAKQAYIDAGSPPLTPDMKTMSVLFYEPDDSATGVYDAILCTNMFPAGIVNELQTVKQEDGAITQHDVEFSATSMEGERVTEMAVKYMESLNKKGFSPRALTPFYSDIQPNVADDSAQTGYRPGVAAVAENL